MIVTAEGRSQIHEIRSGSSYLSQNDLRLHFGLGEADSITSAQILWPSGKDETYKDLAPDFIYTIVEGSGITERTPFTGEAIKAKPDSPAQQAPSP